MTWANFYLICFALGFAFSLLSFVLGGFHWHLPHGLGEPHVHFIPHTHAIPHFHVGHAGHGIAHAGAAKAGTAAPGHVSPFNPVTIAAFLAWFGGTGFLLTRFSTVWFLTGLGIAVLSGAVGAVIVLLFLTRVLMSEEEDLDPADFEMVGVLGRLSMPIRQGGTGELIYSQAGTRRTCGARAEEACAIPKGTEVVVTRYEKGIAYVRRWSEMAGEDAAVDTKPAGGES
jgi:membrane protein implicated in regulation of membrane protease activity